MAYNNVSSFPITASPWKSPADYFLLADLATFHGSPVSISPLTGVRGVYAGRSCALLKTSCGFSMRLPMPPGLMGLGFALLVLPVPVLLLLLVLAPVRALLHTGLVAVETVDAGDG